MPEFKIVNKFRGYVAKRDVTNLEEDGYLIKGSQNVLSTDGATVKARPGYTLDGEANAALSPIRSSYEWLNHRGEERALRLYDDELEYRYVDADGNVTWRRLKDGFATDSMMQFAEWWDATEVQDVLLFVDGSANVYDWSGMVTTIASVGTNTLTKEGSETWAEVGALTTGTRKVVINGVEYAYTGGESTTTLTGVTPDPALASPAIAAGDIAHQAVRTTANSSITGLPAAMGNDLIAVLNNQVYYASLDRRDVYVSKQTNFQDVSYSSPRVPGEGAKLTLDGCPTGFDVQEEFIYVSAGKDQWYQVTFQLSSDLTKETVLAKRLKTTAGEAAISQGAIAKIKNEVVYISNEPTLDTLGRIESVDTPQSKPLSDPIKSDFDAYDFTNVHARYHRNNVYIALPAESVLLIYNIEKKFWEPPQYLPVRRLAVIGGELYFHSSLVPETYKLFDGLNDNGNPITARAVFNYQSFGRRADLKNFTEFYTEGYIGQNTDLLVRIKYDYEGGTQIIEKTIDGQNEDLLFGVFTDPSQGNESLGDMSLSGDPEETTTTDLQKFRVIHTLQPEDIFEINVTYETDAPDAEWQILAYGPQIGLSQADPVNIKD